MYIYIYIYIYVVVCMCINIVCVRAHLPYQILLLNTSLGQPALGNYSAGSAAMEGVQR